MYSLIIPVYKNESNIPDLLTVLNEWNQKTSFELEVVFVVDGSPDNSGKMLLDAQSDMLFNAQIIFHSRNFGSFNAIRTGLEKAKGNIFSVMAADMQEPISLVEQMFEKLASDKADIVFGVRKSRSDGAVKTFLSNSFWSIYRRFVFRDIPKGGIDIFGCNDKVRQSVLDLSEANSSLVAQLFWIGYRRTFVEYERRKREKGKSAWNFSRRVRYMMDSIFTFSDLPILLILWIGIIGSLMSFLIGMVVLFARLLNFINLPGYTVIVVLICFSTSVTLMVQGVLGAYLWRTFENSKRRPLSLVSKCVTHVYKG